MMRLPVLLLATACATACSAPPTTPAPAPSPNGTPATGTSLAAQLSARHWHLHDARTAAGQAITALKDKPGAPLQLDFGDGRINVRGGCNAMGRAYRIERDRIEVGDFQSTLMACADRRLMDADAEAGKRLHGPLAVAIEGERLRLTNAGGDVLSFTGEATAETRFGGSGERVFLEVAAQTQPCSHPLIPDKTCLHVRELHYDANGLKVGTPGGFQHFYDSIEGYTHQPGVRSVLRVKRFERASPPADASRYAWVLDMVVEQDPSGR